MMGKSMRDMRREMKGSILGEAAARQKAEAARQAAEDLAKAETDRAERAEHALRSCSTELARWKDRAQKAEVLLASAGIKAE